MTVGKSTNERVFQAWKSARKEYKRRDNGKWWEEISQPESIVVVVSYKLAHVSSFSRLFTLPSLSSVHNFEGK